MSCLLLGLNFLRRKLFTFATHQKISKEREREREWEGGSHFETYMQHAQRLSKISSSTAIMNILNNIQYQISGFVDYSAHFLIF